MKKIGNKAIKIFGIGAAIMIISTIFTSTCYAFKPQQACNMKKNTHLVEISEDGNKLLVDDLEFNIREYLNAIIGNPKTCSWWIGVQATDHLGGEILIGVGTDSIGTIFIIRISWQGIELIPQQ